MSYLRQDSLYRYHVSREHIDSFLEQTDKVLAEAAAAFEAEVDEKLQGFLLRLQVALGEEVEVEEEALFWIKGSVALLLALSESDEEYFREESRFIDETIGMLER